MTVWPGNLQVYQPWVRCDCDCRALWAKRMLQRGLASCHCMLLETAAAVQRSLPAHRAARGTWRLRSSCCTCLSALGRRLCRGRCPSVRTARIWRRRRAPHDMRADADDEAWRQPPTLAGAAVQPRICGGPHQEHSTLGPDVTCGVAMLQTAASWWVDTATAALCKRAGGGHRVQFGPQQAGQELPHAAVSGNSGIQVSSQWPLAPADRSCCQLPTANMHLATAAGWRAGRSTMLRNKHVKVEVELAEHSARDSLWAFGKD
jgi:hypothetical protein